MGGAARRKVEAKYCLQVTAPRYRAFKIRYRERINSCVELQDILEVRWADAVANIARKMAEHLVHRGPDDAGAWVDAKSGVALGHQRLSIIDLSVEGHQPMLSACGHYVIVYNGEIYNYQEIRDELFNGTVIQLQSPNFRGHSDTEVLLAAISCWGL